MTCSLLWVRCLFHRFSISNFGGKWPLKWKFSKNVFPRLDTELRFVTKFDENRPLRSCRKVLWITTHKKSQPPFCPKWADRAQNSLNVVTPWHVNEYRIWSGSAALCLTYSGKIDISAPKVITMLSAYNNCIGDDTKATARQSLNCIKNKKKHNMAKNDLQYGGCNSYSLQCGTIMTLISPGDCTMQCGMWLWNRDCEFTKWQHPAMRQVALGWHATEFA